AHLRRGRWRRVLTAGFEARFETGCRAPLCQRLVYALRQCVGCTISAVSKDGSRARPYSCLDVAPFEPSLRSSDLLLCSVGIQPNASPAAPYFDAHLLSPPQKVRIVWFPPPCVRVGRIDGHQHSLMWRDARDNNHFAARGEPLL